MFRYPGGKFKLRQKILGKINENKYSNYIEPFFGGGSIGLLLLKNNHNISNICINDKDIGIACIWNSIIHYPKHLCDKILSYQPKVSDFYDIKSELINTDKYPEDTEKIVDIGFKKIVIHQISYSGLGTKAGGPLGGKNQFSQYKINCRWSPKYICKKINETNILFKQIKIKNDKCTNYDFIDLIDNYEDSLIYLDPPYYVKGNDLYQNGFSINDHKKLSESLKKIKTWILSYDDCEEVRELYNWACIENVNTNYSITSHKIDGLRYSRNKSELIIYPKNNI